MVVIYTKMKRQVNVIWMVLHSRIVAIPIKKGSTVIVLWPKSKIDRLPNVLTV